MKNFAFKDLLITLAPPAPGPCDQLENLGAVVLQNGPIVIKSTACCGGGASIPGHIPIWFPFGFGDPFVSSSLLKNSLKAALESVEAGEKTPQENLQPQTVAEAQMLEGKLTEALEEVRTRKAHLERNAA